MTVTWILIANSRRARFFERDPEKADFTEMADFIYPYAAGSLEGPRSISANDHSRPLYGGKRFEARTDRNHLGQKGFASQLAGFINQGVVDQRCDSVALVATDHMLGEIRQLLNDDAAEKLRCSVSADLTRFRGHELQYRIRNIVTLRR
jgi:protein required for attachment to host cells